MTETLEAGAAPETLDILIVAPKALTSREELAFFRQALERAPQSVELRYSLASMLYTADHFDEVIELVGAEGTRDLRSMLLEAEARLARETEADNVAAREAGEAALGVAASTDEKAMVLAMLAKAHSRLGDIEKALECAERALELDVAQKDAYKRAAALLLKHGSPERVLELSDQLSGRGVFHSRLISARTLAFSCMGEAEQAREAAGADRFLQSFHPAPPDGWATLDDFTRDLCEELSNHPDIRFNRYGTASAQTWRIDEPSLKRTPVFPALQRMITREVQKYVAALPREEHHYLSGQPKLAALRNWCVITEGDGHETWHVHQNGWISGVFYAYVPDHIALGTGKEGCIAFGIPEDLVGEENARAFGETVCRPETGLMMLFPSHLFHRTYPHHGTGRRLCCAFDIIPVPAGGA